MTITPKILAKTFHKVKKNFSNHPYAPKEWKDVLNHLPIYFGVCDMLGSIYGMSYMVTKGQGPAYSLSDTAKTVKIGAHRYWLYIELDATLICQAAPQTLYNMVAHEVAHSLDYVIRQKQQDTVAQSHDEFFTVLEKMLGTTGKWTMPNRTKLQSRVKSTLELWNEKVVLV